LALDFYFKRDFLEALVLVTDVVKIFTSPVEPAAHVLFQRIDFEIEYTRRSSPLREMAESEPG